MELMIHGVFHLQTAYGNKGFNNYKTRPPKDLSIGGLVFSERDNLDFL
jgi:hypothetical protein